MKQRQGQPSTMELKQDVHYVLSGGMGALGMVTAQYLLEELGGAEWKGKGAQGEEMDLYKDKAHKEA